jgi:cobalt-precorrin-7 (C5)-methyltransferase
MYKLHVVGLGPGSPEYVTPAALQVLQMSKLILGGRRNLDSLKELGLSNLASVKCVEISGNLAQLLVLIRENIAVTPVTVVASGDPGFYSILRYLKKHFEPEQLHVIAGISSVQYMCAKLCICWENAYVGSLHGKHDNIIGRLHDHVSVVYLTDRRIPLREIVSLLMREGHGDKMIHIGSWLSYKNEKIYTSKIKDFTHFDIDTTLSVMVIADE